MDQNVLLLIALVRHDTGNQTWQISLASPKVITFNMVNNWFVGV